MTRLLLLVILAISFAAHAEHKPRYSTKPQKHRALGLKKKLLQGANVKSIPYKDLGIVVPNSLDLRPFISPIRDQEQCGSCVDFAETEVLRDNMMLAGQDPGNLSAQAMVDCVGNGCNGNELNIADFLLNGVPLWSVYPYNGVAGKCKTGWPVAARAKSWAYIGTKAVASVQDIESYMVMNKSTVLITIYASNTFQQYSGGVFNTCENKTPNHAISIVGFDNEGAAFDSNGNLPPGVGHWIVKNHWTTDWGVMGYGLHVMSDSRGRKCNNITDEAASITPVLSNAPPVPVPGPTPIPTPIPTPPVPADSVPTWLQLLIGIGILAIFAVISIKKSP